MADAGARVLIIGVGAEMRGDDALGLLAVRCLQAERLAGVEVIEHGGDGASLLERWSGAESVMLVDAVASRDAPGTLHRLDLAAQPFPRAWRQHSTHLVSVAEAVELARALHRLPRRLVMHGMSGERFRMGTQRSPAVDQAMPTLVERIRRDVQQWVGEGAMACTNRR